MKHSLFSYLSDNFAGMYHFEPEEGQPYSYSNLVWDSETVAKPTEESLTSKVQQLNDEEPYRLLRIVRNKLLEETDKYGLSDYPFTSEKQKSDWMTYRQDLRNLTSTQTPKLNSNWDLDLASVSFPQKPE